MMPPPKTLAHNAFYNACVLIGSDAAAAGVLVLARPPLRPT
jgi:hypothetical protein